MTFGNTEFVPLFVDVVFTLQFQSIYLIIGLFDGCWPALLFVTPENDPPYRLKLFKPSPIFILSLCSTGMRTIRISLSALSRNATEGTTIAYGYMY
jgi:hypothetical protein